MGRYRVQLRLREVRHLFSNGYNVPLAQIKPVRHEATAAYLFHPHLRHLQPFIGVGGGYLGFMPPAGASQWRGVGLLEAGLDIPSPNPHMGFRVQGRALFYREPNFYNPAISTETWVCQAGADRRGLLSLLALTSITQRGWLV